MAIVVELTPPTLFTVGKSAVPPKSLVNFSFPLVVASASGVFVPPKIVETNSVVANCVVLVPAAAVGAVGMPVNEGDAIGAFNNRSLVLDVTLESNPEIALIVDVILAVFELTRVSNPVMESVLDVMLTVFV